ncbi:hypothetical protein Q8F55_005776 [Vanrija albida]|uniref:CBM1 domain-containing protein n=1 Tax=Vanrija albida TaxID=181172 RepID=A0ABR3Q354_9TREE
MLLKPAIAALLLVATSGLAAPAADQAGSVEARTPTASAPAQRAVALDERGYGYNVHPVPVRCGHSDYYCHGNQWKWCQWSGDAWMCYTYG